MYIVSAEKQLDICLDLLILIYKYRNISNFQHTISGDISLLLNVFSQGFLEDILSLNDVSGFHFHF